MDKSTSPPPVVDKPAAVEPAKPAEKKPEPAPAAAPASAPESKPVPPAKKTMLGEATDALREVLKRLKGKDEKIPLSPKAASVVQGFRIEPHPVSDVPRILIQFQVMTYAQVGEEKGKMVVRLYAHLPPEANEVIRTMISESGIGAHYSPDSFTRPTAN